MVMVTFVLEWIFLIPLTVSSERTLTEMHVYGWRIGFGVSIGLA